MLTVLLSMNHRPSQLPHRTEEKLQMAHPMWIIVIPSQSPLILNLASALLKAMYHAKGEATVQLQRPFPVALQHLLTAGLAAATLQQPKTLPPCLREPTL